MANKENVDLSSQERMKWLGYKSWKVRGRDFPSEFDEIRYSSLDIH